VLSLEGDEVDQDIGVLAERLLEGGRIGTVDLDVVDPGRKLVFTAAADDDVPPHAAGAAGSAPVRSGRCRREEMRAAPPARR